MLLQVQILSWKPSQIDVNSYDLSIRVNDAYNHSDTLPLILSVNAVNDPPSFDIPTEKEIVEWNEDQSAISPVTFNLSRYFFSAFCSSSCYSFSATNIFHSGSKSVSLFSNFTTWLICSFHKIYLLILEIF